MKAPGLQECGPGAFGLYFRHAELVEASLSRRWGNCPIGAVEMLRQAQHDNPIKNLALMITKEQVLQALEYLSPQFSIDDLLRELALHGKSWHDEWNDIVARFKPGTEVNGQVVRKAPFGDFIEIGASEPALLEIGGIPNLTPDLYQLGEYNPLGSIVKAWILGIPSRRTKQLRLTQDPSIDFEAVAKRLPN